MREGKEGEIDSKSAWLGSQRRGVKIVLPFCQPSWRQKISRTRMLTDDNVVASERTSKEKFCVSIKCVFVCVCESVVR